MRALLLILLASPASAELSLLDAVVCEDIKAREPVGVAKRFAVSAERLAVFLRVKNTAEPTALEVVWRHEGEIKGKVKLKAGRSLAWRTWGRQRLHGLTGKWVVDVYAPGGKRLKRLRFSVTAGAGPRPGKRDPPTASAPSKPAPKKADAVRPKAERVPAKRAPKQTKVAPATPEAGCRALVNVELAGVEGPDRYAVADLRIARPGVPTERGLVVRDGRHLHALRMYPREVVEKSAKGIVRRQWDMLMGARFPNGAKVTWAGYPATLAPPEKAGDALIHETNRLQVLAMMGPFLALRADLSGYAGRSRGPFDHARYTMVRAPGRVADPTALLGPWVVGAALRRLSELRIETSGELPDPGKHDFRRSVLVPKGRGVALKTFMRCCTWEENRGRLDLEVPVQVPEGLRTLLPDEEGFFEAPDGCGAVGFSKGRLLARLGKGSAKALRLDSGERVARMLGVVWPGAQRFDLERFAKLARLIRP